MALNILSRSTARAALKTGSSRASRCFTTSQIRTKATLPDLPYDYAALEPAISGQIMEIHHSRHHQTYVTSLNTASEKLATLQSSASASTPSSLAAQLALQPLIRFHAGGHVNHSLFWENLAPASQGGGEAKGPVVAEIERVWGGMGVFKKEFEGVLAGVQGSGWAWLVKEGGTGGLRIVARANQDVVGAGLVPLLGVDAWEHAYYLQYQNRKVEYFKAIWDVINWKTVNERFANSK